jgi:isopropylmalate/homocitrate/citramalate synthase
MGIGERTGNCPVEAMAMEYAALRGGTNGMDLSAITDIAEYFERKIGYTIPPMTPFVGRSFNSTRAGIHADGLLKDEEIYNIFDTAAILNRPATVAVDSHSGLAGIAHWINSYYKLGSGMAVDKRDAIVAALRAKVDELYAEGRNTVMGDGEMDSLLMASDYDLYIKFTDSRKR